MHVQPRRRSRSRRVGPERVVTVAVAVDPARRLGHQRLGRARRPQHRRTNGAGTAPRIAVGGSTRRISAATNSAGDRPRSARRAAATPAAAVSSSASRIRRTRHRIDFGGRRDLGDVASATSSRPSRPDGHRTRRSSRRPFTEDGTLLKPIAVDTTVRRRQCAGPDLHGQGQGDASPAIAAKFDVSMMRSSGRTTSSRRPTPRRPGPAHPAGDRPGRDGQGGRHARLASPTE